MEKYKPPFTNLDEMLATGSYIVGVPGSTAWEDFFKVFWGILLKTSHFLSCLKILVFFSVLHQMSNVAKHNFFSLSRNDSFPCIFQYASSTTYRRVWDLITDYEKKGIETRHFSLAYHMEKFHEMGIYISDFTTKLLLISPFKTTSTQVWNAFSIDFERPPC